MRLLLDENTHWNLVRVLTELGHDVLAVRRTTSDDLILAQAVAENRILITHDRDFGDLIFRQGSPHRGVIYLRLSSTLQDVVAERIRVALAAGYPEDAFLVVGDRTIRRRQS